MAAGRTGNATTAAHVAPARVARFRIFACACALAMAFAFVLATASSASAEEVGGSGDDSFELNLAMEVNPTADPNAEVRSVAVQVGNDAGERVAGANVAFELEGAYAAVSTVERPADAAMVPAGAVLTGADGTAVIEGLVPNCDYRVVIVADGHERFEDVRACKGFDGERWEVVLTKSRSGGGLGDGSEPGAAGTVSPLPLSPGSVGAPWHDWWLAMTGDPAAPWALGAAAVLLAALAAVVVARRKARGDGA